VINGATIERNRFQPCGETQSTPFIQVVNPNNPNTGGTTDFVVRQNVFEVAPAMQANENNSILSVRFVDNGVGDGSPGANNPYGIWIMATSGSIIEGNYFQGQTTAIQLGNTSETNFTTRYATRVLSNIIYGDNTGVLDYALGTNISYNSISTLTANAIEEYGQAHIEGNYLVAAGLINLSTPQNFVGTNNYYQGGLSCPGWW
jgi:hypothetical protein